MAEYSDNARSKYCKPCRKKARVAWRAMVEKTGKERDARNAKWEELFTRAQSAANAALVATVPTPMLVVEHANPADDNSDVVKTWNAPSGVCGFSWIDIHPGNCSFALWLAKHKGAKRGYYGGMQYWIHGGGQSYEKKTAAAQAFADVLRETDIDARDGGRLD
jgi:hypothetical protein